MNKFELKTEITQYEHSEELPLDEQNLLSKAKEACFNAYAPYSEFKVGVALLLENGEIITGSNQENAAYPSGLCAERTAIFWANSQYPEKAIVKMAISSLNKNNKLSQLITPCGACRQVMIETELRFKQPIKTILDGENKIISIDKVSDLLPLYFNADELK
ncbi:cytidine deaminase [Plebeiibacterium sediminum]|uniref:Cytidine deaminase n=1 Tax=Plebeiibacterium sediminum TaxID=2992112 RepID=A0AAE3M400_9BACT|nr:cytidine deaminase [Plebeiobacterium sediminum]MCW3786694.1 cytidine deaminase [Plebeiobacterium sediminum]